MSRHLRSDFNDLASTFADLHLEVVKYLEAGQCLSEKIKNSIFDSDGASGEISGEAPLTENEVRNLLALNRCLIDLRRHLKTVVEDVQPRLESKLADVSDPMADYEIDVKIAYVLRQGDLEFNEDDDNYLTTRYEMIRNINDDEDESEDYAECSLPEDLRAEAHCWYFHDLYDHSYGIERPRLSLRDCLRVAQIFIDVEILQQYRFDVDRGTWSATWFEKQVHR